MRIQLTVIVQRPLPFLAPLQQLSLKMCARKKMLKMIVKALGVSGKVLTKEVNALNVRKQIIKIRNVLKEAVYGIKNQKNVTHAMKQEPVDIVQVRVVFGKVTFVCLAVQEVQVRVNAKVMGVPGKRMNVFRVVNGGKTAKRVLNLDANGT